MDETASPKIVERIRKLLALAHDARGNPNEVAAAAAAASKLLSDHKLSESDITTSVDDGSDLVDVPAGSAGFQASWKFSLITATARAFYCDAIGLKVGQRRKVRLVGRRQDVEVVTMVFEFLLKEIERLTDMHALDPKDPIDELYDGHMADRERIAFYRSGLAAGVSSTLAEQAKTMRAASEKALVLARKSREEIRSYLSTKFGSSNHVEPERPEQTSDFSRGYERGLRIEVVVSAKSDGESRPEPTPVASSSETAEQAPKDENALTQNEASTNNMTQGS